MRKKLLFLAFGATALAISNIQAQNVKFKAVAEMNRQDDGEQMTSQYVGFNYNIPAGTDDDGVMQYGKPIFIVSQGIYTMTWDGSKLTSPVKEPAVNMADFYKSGTFTDDEKALWATNFNQMAGNSGAVYVDGTITTVMSRDDESTPAEEIFTVRKWDAKTGDLLFSRHYNANRNLESAGMSYNPLDGKVYGLFYLTEQDLPDEIKNDPDYFEDSEGDATGTDAGYAVCTIDLNTMQVTPVTPGLYYRNFITFAINSEGRAFALTSGGVNAPEAADGKLYDINGNLTGAQLCEFDLTTGFMYQVPFEAVDAETGETYTDYAEPFEATGYASQYRRQSACFAKSNPNKMYWNGFYNSGKGVNGWGSWGELPDRDTATGQTWRDNHKYDTCLYEVDITTGEATRLANIPDRWRFSAIWADGDDCSDGASINEIAGVKPAMDTDRVQVFNINGQMIFDGKAANLNLPQGLYVIRNGANTQKMLVK